MSRLINEIAMNLARANLDVVAPCLREEERKEVFELFVGAARAMLESYEAQVRHERRRLDPTGN